VRFNLRYSYDKFGKGKKLERFDVYLNDELGRKELKECKFTPTPNLLIFR
jgi:hypothetical protein